MMKSKLLATLLIMALVGISVSVGHFTASSRGVAFFAAVGLDGPKIVIDAPAQVNVGDLIVVDVSKSIGSGFAFKVLPQPQNLHADSNGTRWYWGTGKDNTTFLVIVSCADDGQSVIDYTRITVGASIETPNVHPIIKLLTKQAQLVIAPKKREEAIKLAQAFRSVAELIKNGSLRTAAEIIEATADANKKSLGISLHNWVPLLDALISEININVKVNTMEEYRQVWMLISTTFETIAN